MPLPAQLHRFVRLPGAPSRFVTLEDLVGLHLARLFPDFEVVEQGCFRIIRDSEIDIDEEAVDLVRGVRDRTQAPAPGRFCSRSTRVCPRTCASA